MNWTTVAITSSTKQGVHKTLDDKKLCMDKLKVLAKVGKFGEEYSVRQDTAKCTVGGRNNPASFDINTGFVAHQTSSVSHDTRVCEVTGCSFKGPPFWSTEKKPMRCRVDKLLEMVSHKFCSIPGCNATGSLALTEIYVRCVKDEQNELLTSRCEVDGCSKPPLTVQSVALSIPHAPCTARGGIRGYQEPAVRIWRVQHGSFVRIHRRRQEDMVPPTPFKRECELLRNECPMACCVDGGPDPPYMHPAYDVKTSDCYHKKICSFARKVLIEDAIMNDDQSQSSRAPLKHDKSTGV